MDFGFTIFLFALALIFIGFSFATKEKTLFLVLAAVLFIFIGISLIATPLTNTAVAPAYSNSTGIVPPTVITENISIPSPYNSLFSILIVALGLFVGFKGIIVPQEPVKPIKRDENDA